MGTRDHRVVRATGRTLLALALVLCAARARADLATNGSYETGPANPDGIMTLAAGSTVINSWVVSRGTIEYISDPYWQSEDGTSSLALNGDGPGGIAQTFATAPGAVYAVSFWMSGEPFSTPVIKHMRVLAAGQSADFTFDTTPVWHWAMGWQQHTWNFTANSTSTTLEFISLDDGIYSPTLDNVQIGLVSASVGTSPGARLWLGPAHPNPTRGPLSVEFELPRADHVTIRVLDLAGRVVSRVADGWFPGGRHSVPWDARAISGARPAAARSGLYFLELRTGEGRLARRFTFIP